MQSRKMDSKLKIKDIINILTSPEAMFRSGVAKNDEILSFFKEYKQLLNGIGHLTTAEFTQILKKSSNNKKNKSNQKTISFCELSFGEIEEILQNTKVLKNDLLLLAEERFGIPSGSHKKTKKEELVEIIKKAMDNEKTITVISNNASK